MCVRGYTRLVKIKWQHSNLSPNVCELVVKKILSNLIILCFTFDIDTADSEAEFDTVTHRHGVSSTLSSHPLLEICPHSEKGAHKEMRRDCSQVRDWTKS